MGQPISSPHRKITAQDRAILDLKLQRDKLKQYRAKIQTVLDKEVEIARRMIHEDNKPKALLALRRRKYQQSLLEKTDSQLATLEHLTSTIEFSLIEKDVLFGLRQGNAVLKEIHKQISIESVEKLMGDTAEAIAQQREITQLLASHMTNSEEAEVEEELQMMELELQSASKKNTIPATLPNVPSSNPSNMTTEDSGSKVVQPHGRKAELVQQYAA